MTRQIVYYCDACGAIGSASWFGKEERPPNPSTPEQDWCECNTEHLIGIYHVCSDRCWEEFLNKSSSPHVWKRMYR